MKSFDKNKDGVVTEVGLYHVSQYSRKALSTSTKTYILSLQNWHSAGKLVSRKFPISKEFRKKLNLSPKFLSNNTCTV